MNAVKECTRELLSCILASMDLPAILFLDDLQWADGASLDVLRFLLASRELRGVMFVCAYRSNEVDESHSFAKLMGDVAKARGTGDESKSEIVLKMELFGLSPRTVARFVADCVKAEDPEDVADLAEVIYKKTMGNIFFTKQALEELVRKNILFYDVMCFEWRWVVDKAELEDYVSDDVVKSVKGKIRQLDDDVRILLTAMAYIPNALDLSLLASLMSFGGQKFNEAEIEGLLRQSSDEGMTLRSADGGDYAIAHDRIRQASLELAAEDGEEEENGERGPSRGYDLPLHVSDVLLRRAEKDSKGPESERSLFVACDLRNRLPPGTVNARELAKLNLRVSRVAKGRGSSSRERELLRKGLKGLEEAGGRWKKGDYPVTLKLYNALIVSEHSLGSFDKARLAIDEVIKHAATMDEKIVAYLYRLFCDVEETRDYAQAVEDGIKTLKLYGYAVPTAPSKACMAKEKMKLKVALRSRSYSCLVDLPIADVPILSLLNKIALWAMFSGKDEILRFVAWKAIQCVYKKGGIDGQFPVTMAILGTSVAKEGRVREANEIGGVALSLAEKVRDDKENYAIAQVFVCAHVVQLRPFRGSAACLWDCHTSLKLVGNTEFACASMLHYAQAYFAVGFELGPILETKLRLAEEYCRKFDRMSFLTTFQICRQFALNLRKKMVIPAAFRGEAFDEEEALSKLDGPARSMVLRDASSLRLQLAFLYSDEDTMLDMLKRLERYPLTDHAILRCHNRLCFTGLAVFALGKKSGMHRKLGEDCLTHFAHLAKKGSINARPVHLLMLAVKCPRRDSFLGAIGACAEAELIHLEAIASEHYAAFLRAENDVEVSNQFLTAAYWLYQDWGAHAKALALSETYAFLKKSKRKNAKSLTSQSDNWKTYSTSDFDKSSVAGSRTAMYSFNTTLKTRKRSFLTKRGQIHA